MFLENKSNKRKTKEKRKGEKKYYTLKQKI